MLLLAVSVVPLVALLLLSYMTGGGCDSAATLSPSPQPATGDESDQPSASSLGVDPKAATRPFWIVYYRLKAGGTEQVCRYSNNTVHQFPTGKEASEYARFQIKQKYWYSARWAMIGH